MMAEIAVLRASDAGQSPHRVRDARTVSDSLILEVANIETDVLTGVYSEETGRPQPLRISISVALAPELQFTPDTPLSASKNYMDLKFAATAGLPVGVHFTLIESIADHIAETLFLQDVRVDRVTVKIVKLAISEAGEEIGMTLTRHRRG
jgi:dihydroneopterin aldolase